MRVFRRAIAALLLVFLLSVPILATYNGDTTVYITETGEKYHKKDCGYLWNSSYEIPLSIVVTAGYTPCSLCNPPVPPDGSNSYTGGTGGNQSNTPKTTPTPTSDIAAALEQIEQVRKQAKNSTGNAHYDGLKGAGAPLAETAPKNNAGQELSTDNAAGDVDVFSWLGIFIAIGWCVVVVTGIIGQLRKKRREAALKQQRLEEERWREISAKKKQDFTVYVYISDSGNVYHMGWCEHAQGMHSVPLSQVGNRRPCKVCRPPEKEGYTR